ncbi:MAG: U32 family peptidase [Eubacterium sp.]|nr:U32 family peptidase [Eubacterium sp.]
MPKTPEILAPCGSIDTFYAAVNAGCDAVYLSGKQFGARAYAANFSSDEILQALDFAHVYGVKVYLTINTLYKNEEIGELVAFLKPLYLEGLDAVIVQDMGAFYVVKHEFPGLPIHASTQMNICSYKGAGMMKNLGASRVVPARELTLPEIRLIKQNVDIEVECFVHGAMCFCYSGRCLMSSFEGGRSGNRGRCAQPCRLRYDAGYAMSMKDMCTVTDIPELMDAGIDSFKIEGRMKNEYYVASAVDAYKTMADDHASGCFSMDKALKYKKRLMDIFNRGGFSGGYYKCHDGISMIDLNFPGRAGVYVADIVSVGKGTVDIKAVDDIHKGDDMEIRGSSVVKITSGMDISAGKRTSLNAPKTKQLKPGDRIYRTRFAALQDDIKKNIIDKKRKIPVRAFLEAYTGDRLKLTFTDGENFVTARSDSVLEPSQKGTTEVSILEEKVGKLGNTSFVLESMECDIKGEPFISMGILTELKRNAAGKLESEIIQGYKRTEAGAEVNRTDYESTIKTDGDREDDPAKSDGNNLSVIVEEPAQLKSVISSGVDILRIILDHSFINGDYINELREQSHSLIYLATPYISRCDDDSFEKYIVQLKELCSKRLIDGIYIRNHDALAAVAEFIKNEEFTGIKLILAPSLYIYNDKALLMYEDILKSDVQFVFSEELNKERLMELKPYREGRGILRIYGRTVLMLSANDIKGNIKEDFIKKDSEMCYNMLLDGRAVDIWPVDRGDDFMDLLIHFTNETEGEAADVLKRFSEGRGLTGRHYTGHFDGDVI